MIPEAPPALILEILELDPRREPDTKFELHRPECARCAATRAANRLAVEKVEKVEKVQKVGKVRKIPKPQKSGKSHEQRKKGGAKKKAENPVGKILKKKS